MGDANLCDCSPSGLFTRRAWADEMDDRPADRGAMDDLEFARWVHGQAKMLATHLDRLARSEPSEPLARQVTALADTLWTDAEWARRRIDGSFAAAAE
ncbi:MAG TPA: hypothetical protein VFO41_12770 [Alphaproteobacteria bacterium]|nr:hypothetical protein [Alphaproteobacteria bacterium]